MMCRTLFGGAVAVAGLLVATACGSSADSDDTAQTTTEVADEDLTVQIVEPADGAEIAPPFTLELDVGVDIGPPESGLHHVHLFFDGEMANFEIVDSETWEVSADSDALAGLEPGEHVLNVTLNTAEHEPVGAEDEIGVTLTGTGGESSDSPSDSPGDPYEY